MTNSVWPHRQQPTRLPCPWDSPGKNTGVGCHFLLQCMKVKSESEFTQLCPTLSDPMDCSLPGSSIHGIFQARVSRQHVKKQRHCFASKHPHSQSYGFSNSHVQIWEWGHKEGWVPKSWCFPVVMLEKTIESPLDHKEIKPINPKGNQPWICIGKIAPDAKATILWLPYAKNWLIGKYPDAGRDWRQKDRGVAEGEMVR